MVREDVEPIGHEWANDPNPSQVTLCYLDSLEDAVRVANEETSGLAASIVAEDADAARRFLDAYRGTAAYWNETTRLTDGWKLTGAPETGINVDWTPGPRGPVTYRDLWLQAVPRRVKRPVVVKLGSSLVAASDGSVRRSVVRARAREVAELVRGGTPVCVVSSGAIALGLPRLGLSSRPRALPKLQAASALGQARLQRAWDDALAREGLAAAQVLLTATDVSDRAAYLNARNTLGALFALGAVPVVNENDATATDEITFGDNDALAAQVAILVRARLLVLLTEVEGVYSRAPGTPGAELLAAGARGSRGRARRRLAARQGRDGRARCSRPSWPRRPGSRP